MGIKETWGGLGPLLDNLAGLQGRGGINGSDHAFAFRQIEAIDGRASPVSLYAVAAST